MISRTRTSNRTIGYCTHDSISIIPAKPIYICVLSEIEKDPVRSSHHAARDHTPFASKYHISYLLEYIRSRLDTTGLSITPGVKAFHALKHALRYGPTLLVQFCYSQHPGTDVRAKRRRTLVLTLSASNLILHLAWR